VSRTLLIPLLIPLLLISGCQPQLFTQKKTLSEFPQPPTWTAAPTADQSEPGAWLDSFTDPTLYRLITEGLQNNFSLQSAAARIRAAQARATQAGAELLPTAILDSSAARRKTQPSGSVNNSFSLTGRVQWEIDLWGRFDLSARAATAEAKATQTDYRAAQLSLAANIARSWFQLCEAGLQLRLAEQIVASYQQSLQVIEEQYRSGLTSALDLRLARSELSSAQASQAERARLFDSGQRALEQLLGRYPSGSLASSHQLPELSAELPVGLPSTLLQRRPDIQASELRLQAAELRTTAAQRNRLPTFALTGSAGTASERLYRLLDWDYLVWSLAASATQSLFDGGRKAAEQQLTKAQFDEQLNTYAEKLLTAFREVEGSLASEDSLRNQERALQQTVSEADEAQHLAEQRYRQGLEGIITLLETQRRAFSARSNLLRTSRLRLENRVDLHLALAGPIGTFIPLHEGMETP